jgi:hypothetical protein
LEPGACGALCALPPGEANQNGAAVEADRTEERGTWLEISLSRGVLSGRDALCAGESTNGEHGWRQLRQGRYASGRGGAKRLARVRVRVGEEHTSREGATLS